MKHLSHFIILIICTFGLSINGTSQTYTYNNGWTSSGGATGSSPNSSSNGVNVVVQNGTVAFQDGWKMNNLTIETGGHVTFNGSTSFEVNANLTIEGGASLLIQGTGSVDILGNLDIENTGALAITGSGSVSVAQTSTMEVTGSNSSNQYNIWGSMFSGSNILTTMGTPNPCDVYAYDATQQTWKYDYAAGFTTTCLGNSVTFAASDLVTDGTADGNYDVARGYFIVGDASTPTRTFSSSGAPNNGTITYPIYGTSIAIPDGNDWNLLANPYPSGISVASFLTTNSSLVGTAVYLYNGVDGTWDTENSGNIAAGQGFFVDPSTTSDGNLGNAQFLNSHRTDTNNNFRSGNYQFAHLSLTTPGGVNDRLKVFMDINASNEFDRVWDARKMTNDIALHLASYIDTSKYAINGIQPLALNESFTMDLFVEVPDAGNYSLSLDTVSNIQNHSWVIKDKQTGFSHNLNNSPFNISVNSAQAFTNRYQLIITNQDWTTSVDDIDQQWFSCQCVNNNLFVDGLGNQLESVSVIDLSGRIMIQKPVTSSSINISTNDIPKGIYLVTVKGSSGKMKTFKTVIP